MQGVINPEVFKQAHSLFEQFHSAEPFRHILIRDFLADSFLGPVSACFPEPVEAEMLSEFGDRSLKHTVEDLSALGEPFQQWDAMLKSKGFIAWLETVTGMSNLIFDPTYVGAGTHNNFCGQSLDMHIDFNRHPVNGLHRRLNLIVYLCPEWDLSWGGCLKLQKDAWDRTRQQQERVYPPFMNHAVLFETNERSWHGFDEIKLPEDKQYLSRRSLTVYYYSKHRETNDVADEHSTIYVPDWIPPSVKPGEVLSEDAYRDLAKVMYRRDHYLQHLYKRERTALDRAADALKRIAHLDRLHRLIRFLMPWRYR
jgi:Rps23 Pro-64 3,4-dihydroxylase Tpa1-like proline 4-hydroxylase